MHEMSLAEGVIQIVEDAARAAQCRRVSAVILEIGRLSSVEPEALRFCFDAVSRGSIAEGARLEIEDVPGTAWCMQCSESVEVAARLEGCPRCGSYQLQVTGGTEMRVKEVEIE
ncbi:MAG: hydrogenase maturation nickel metallochaperone HypA [Rhodocyclaceae bacterium]|nr:hydrogenase maturation nickel metallochaperone HypA [Rhodocyclaceae bacterium]